MHSQRLIGTCIAGLKIALEMSIWKFAYLIMVNGGIIMIVECSSDWKIKRPKNFHLFKQCNNNEYIYFSAHDAFLKQKPSSGTLTASFPVRKSSPTRDWINRQNGWVIASIVYHILFTMTNVQETCISKWCFWLLLWVSRHLFRFEYVSL